MTGPKDASPIDVLKTERILRIKALTQEALAFTQTHGLDFPDGFERLDPRELEKLGLAILACQTVSQAYDLLAATPSDRRLTYYDRLIAEPQHMQTYKELDHIIKTVEQKRVARAIDVATGTGFCAKLLSQRADHMVAIDTSPALLRVAEKELRRLQKHRKYMKTFRTQQMDALTISYPDNHFDIATSNAFTHYLTFDEQQAFYREMHRILKPGGRYYEPQQSGSLSTLNYSRSPRGMLAEAISGGVLLTRDTAKFGMGTKKVAPDPENYGFKVNTYVFAETPFIRQVTRCVKV